MVVHSVYLPVQYSKHAYMPRAPRYGKAVVVAAHHRIGNHWLQVAGTAAAGRRVSLDP
jgi:hypothetical protein